MRHSPGHSSSYALQICPYQLWWEEKCIAFIIFTLMFLNDGERAKWKSWNMTIRTLNLHFTFNYMYYSSQHQCLTMIKYEMRRNELGSKMSEVCSSYRRVYFRFDETSRTASICSFIHMAIFCVCAFSFNIWIPPTVVSQFVLFGCPSLLLFSGIHLDVRVSIR